MSKMSQAKISQAAAEKLEKAEHVESGSDEASVKSEVSEKVPAELTELKKIFKILLDMFHRVSYIESRLDSMEAKTSDTLRHVSQHLTEYSVYSANGSIEILQSWLLDQKAGFFRANLRLSLKETEISEAWKFLMGASEAQIRCELENTQMHSAIQYLKSAEAKKSQRVKEELEKAYIESCELSELGLRNLERPCWTQMRVPEEDLEFYAFPETFSEYLKTETELAMAAMRKSKALKIRLTQEYKMAKSENLQGAKALQKLKIKASEDIKKLEIQAEKKGAEVDALI